MTEPKAFQGIECEVCGREFEDLPQLRGHVRFPEGSVIPEPCPGGIA